MNMINYIYKDIESLEFDVRMNVVSGCENLKKIVSKSPEYKKLYEDINIPGTQGVLLISDIQVRIMQLCEIESEQQYENPNDMAIFTYLYAISECDYKVDLGYFLEHVFQTLNLFWARKLALELKEIWDEIHEREERKEREMGVDF